MNLADFQVDEDKCIGCGKCVRVCPGGLISIDEKKKAVITDVDCFGWDGCWQCEHCLAVCPRGAIQVLGKKPEDSLLPVDAKESAPMMEALIANRHSCRRYLDKNVEPELIEDLIQLLANAPNGGNKQQVEFTLIDDKEKMQYFREIAYAEMERLAAEGIYPEGFDQPSYEDMKRWEQTVRPDMLFCGAPHLLIPHAPLGRGEPVQDVVIAGTYFELLCASRGLGAVMLTFPLGVLNRMPKIKAMLEIPEDHYIGMVIGFGYPEIRYARGAQRTVEESRIHRLNFQRGADRK
jgi:nitroreductase/NAD-dependent dihydropyrimidine dehydrogenase PreA subunit